MCHGRCFDAGAPHADSARNGRGGPDGPCQVAKEGCELCAHQDLHGTVACLPRNNGPREHSDCKGHETTDHTDQLQLVHPSHVGRPEPQLRGEYRRNPNVVAPQRPCLRLRTVCIWSPSAQPQVWIVVAIGDEHVGGRRSSGARAKGELRLAERVAHLPSHHSGKGYVERSGHVPRTRLVQPSHRLASESRARQAREHVRQSL
mmetsp:Transcript_65122/g.173555  ORF Transcript_65122/g.173555 Transcript_65122/m.173555 type:complete len:203 (-) Transcript_65122:133-741(-)